MSFGKALSQARRDAGLQQKELAAKVIKESGGSISTTYLNDIEHDKRSPPSDYLIQQFSLALEIPEAYLFYMANKLPPAVRNQELDKKQIDRVFKQFSKAINRAAA